MAKLKAPLFSLGASGQLGKALVFFGWKGLDVVREYIIPANPKTDPQKLQRGYMTDAVAMIHTAQARPAQPLGSLDVTAYALWATVVQAATTWFNQAVRAWVNVKVDSKIPVIYSGGVITETSKDDFRMDIKFNEEVGFSIAAGKFYLGISRTNLIKSEDATIVENVGAYLADGSGFSGLTAGTKYFWQFRPDPAGLCKNANSGIYHAVATA